MELIPVDKKDVISGQDFRDQYLKACRPLVIKNLTKDWRARTTWNYAYFKNVAGDKQVPVYNNNLPSPDSAVNAPDDYMRFGDYLDLIATRPTDLRIFLFNIFDHVPALLHDFNYFDELCGGFLKKYPMMFFGGAGSKVRLHFDMDLSHVFITQFKGKKRVIMFDQSYSEALYRMPFMVQSYIDPEEPDYEKFPALRNIRGYETILEDGETLFMPSGIWHYMSYLEGGYALSLRSMDTPLTTRLKGLYYLFVMRQVDDFMKKSFRQRWYYFKNDTARKRADRIIQKAIF